MMDKLMLFGITQIIMIGRRIITLLVLLIMSGCCIFCDEELPEKIYDVGYFNSTNDTLVLERKSNVNNIVYDSYILMPYGITYDEDLDAFIYDEENPILNVFDGKWSNDMDVIIMRNDSIKITWQGPAREMGDSVNHIYNYSSWEIIDYPRDSLLDGEIRFTIYESDFD